MSNFVVLAIILAFVLQNPQPNSGIKPAILSSATGSSAPINPLDQVSAVDVAQTVAAIASLPETPLVNGQAIAQRVTNMYTLGGDTGSSVLSKPQVVTTAFKSNQDIQTYIVQSGDTIASLAAKFNVTSDSIRWSNNVYGNSLTPGKSLLIPPVSGIVYTVKAGDTSRSLAQDYGSNENLIIAYNDAELSGLRVGERVIIPGGTTPTSTYYGFGYAGGAAGSYNLYAQWNCTWWVAKRWAETGRPTMPLLGNGGDWYGNAKDIPGMSVGTTPRAYAAAVTSKVYSNGFAHPLGANRIFGHVVFVESVNDDESINISEMNIGGENTWYPTKYIVTKSTVPADKAAGYYYIY